MYLSYNLCNLITNYILLIMKTMTCKQLGGSCDKEFHAATFEEMAELSKNHGMEMFKSADKDHLKAMQNMQELMNSPEAMETWFQQKREEFNVLPLDSKSLHE